MLGFARVKSPRSARLSAAPLLALSLAVVAAAACVAPEHGGDHGPSTQVWEGAQVVAAFGADGVGPTLSYPHTFDRLGVQWDVGAVAGGDVEPRLEVRTSAQGRIWYRRSGRPRAIRRPFGS